jgi:hypothetical protein
MLGQACIADFYEQERGFGPKGISNMGREINTEKYFIVTIMVLSLITSMRLVAQTSANAPKPSQLTAAKTVFISNETDSDNAESEKNYNRFYESIQKINRFTIVLDPSKADIVLELNVIATPGSGKDNRVYVHHRLRIIDPKTHIVLWSVSEDDGSPILQSSRDKNAQNASDHLAAYLQTITTPPAN